MIYSWKIVMDGGWTKHVAAEDAQITDSGAIALYLDNKVVSAFWEWVSIERLPSE